jgi:hypothetical protein
VLFALGGNVQFAIDPDPAAQAGLFFIAAYLALGLFGLNPKAQALFEAAPARSERLSVPRLVLLGLAIAITPTLLGAELLAGGERDGLLLLNLHRHHHRARRHAHRTALVPARPRGKRPPAPGHP